MIHCRDHLINWLINNSTQDVLLQNAFRHPGSRVELLGLFNPLPGSVRPGWLVKIITYRKREDLIAVVQDHLDRPCRWYVTDRVSWDTWQGPDDDVLIGGDENGKEKETTGRFDRIKRCAPVCIKPNRITGERAAGPPVVKKKTHPPSVSAG
jgi:hypothetical protein